MLKIEDTDIKMWDTLVHSSAKCTIKNDVFSCLRQEETLFNSEIFKYNDLGVVACREPRFGEHYLNIAVYDDSFERAWPLVTLSQKMDIYIRRLGKDTFLIWTNTQEQTSDIKQCSFCRLHDTEKIDNTTIDYNALLGLEIIEKENILIEYSNVLGGVGGVAKKLVTTLALFNKYGKLIKVFYEFYEKDAKTYSHKFKEDKMQLIITIKNGKESSKAMINLSKILTAVAKGEPVPDDPMQKTPKSAQKKSSAPSPQMTEEHEHRARASDLADQPQPKNPE